MDRFRRQLSYDQIKVLDRISEQVRPARIQIFQGRLGDIWVVAEGHDETWRIWPGGPAYHYENTGKV